jgi:predicted TIM-barrel fold metal-dependent hydrolase
MGKSYPLKIDAFAHIVPKKYKKAVEKLAPKEAEEKIEVITTLHDLDYRFQIMDRYEGLVQVIAPAWPPVEDIADSQAAVDLARLLNDGMAELVFNYPDRFIAAIACLPMNNMESALMEAERAIEKLCFRGVLIYTPINDKPLDSPEFIPLYEKMAQYNLPIFLHPMRPPSYPDYRTEKESKYRIFSMFGWPYETTAAMTRLVFSGILEEYANLKFVTHHCGGMVPYFAERIKQFQDIAEIRRHLGFTKGLPRHYIEYYKMFYADTALYGNPTALMCGHDFFGPDHLIFGVDMPLGCTELGNRNYRQTINAIEQMAISEEDKNKIYADNACRLMRLPI